MTKKELSELGQLSSDIKDMEKNIGEKFTKIEYEMTGLKNEVNDGNTKFSEFKEEVKKSLETKPSTTYATSSQPDKRMHIVIDLNTPDNIKSWLIIAPWIFLAIMSALVFLQNAKIEALQEIQ